MTELPRVPELPDVPDLADELRALGGGVTVQVRDDLADRVLARIAEPTARTIRWRRWLAALAAALAAIGISAAVSAPVRATIVRVFHFGGVEVRPQSGPTPVASPTLPHQLATDLAAAQREVGFAVRVPSAFGPPEVVTVADGRVVTLEYTRPGGTVRIDEFAGNLGVMWDKYAAGKLAQRVTVNGHDALWFDGPVTLVYVGPNGSEESGSARRTNATLIWTDGPLTCRLDGVRPLASAIAIAESMR